MAIETKDGYYLAEDGYVSSDDEWDFYEDGGFTSLEKAQGLTEVQVRAQKRFERYLKHPELERKRMKAKKLWRRTQDLLKYLNAYPDKRTLSTVLGSTLKNMPTVHPNSAYDEVCADGRKMCNSLADVDMTMPYIVCVSDKYVAVESHTAVAKIVQLCTEYSRRCGIVCLENEPIPLVFYTGYGARYTAQYLLGNKEAEYLDKEHKFIIAKGVYAPNYTSLRDEAKMVTTSPQVTPLTLVECPIGGQKYVYMHHNVLRYMRPRGCSKDELVEQILAHRPLDDEKFETYWQRISLPDIRPCQDQLEASLVELKYRIVDGYIRPNLEDEQVRKWIEQMQDCKDVDLTTCLKTFAACYGVDPSIQQFTRCLEQCGYEVDLACTIRRVIQPKFLIVVRYKPMCFGQDYTLMIDNSNTITVNNSTEDPVLSWAVRIEMDEKHACAEDEEIIFKTKLIEKDDPTNRIITALKSAFIFVDSSTRGPVFVSTHEKFINAIKKLICYH